MRVSSVASHLDVEVMTLVIQHSDLHKLAHSEFIYAGNCPFCGHEKSFVLWRNKAAYRCFWCGCDGRFVRTPERELERKKREQAKRGIE
jgi:Zn ribbon nucleic-acid-binding protein